MSFGNTFLIISKVLVSLDIQPPTTTTITCVARVLMKSKGVSYLLKNELLKKCLGCYRVTTEKKIIQCNLEESMSKVIKRKMCQLSS